MKENVENLNLWDSDRSKLWEPSLKINPRISDIRQNDGR
jgi:hypothetical protein